MMDWKKKWRIGWKNLYSLKIRILFGKEGYKKWIEKIDFRQKN